MPLPFSGRRESKRAYRYSLHTCGECPHLHIALHDEEGNIYADFTMSREQVLAFEEFAMNVLVEGGSR